MSKLLIEIQYLGPVAYYRKLSEYDSVIIEKHEHYEKGTYRNRCYISGPNGRLRLSVPLQKGKHQRADYAGVKISADHPWQNIHWQSLCSAYRRSPYFEYYEDRFRPFYAEKQESLFDFNAGLMRLVLELLGMKLNLEYSTQYEKQPEGVDDFRSVIIPGMKSEGSLPVYHQVFGDRVGFIENLSIVDLLFNEGPQTLIKLIERFYFPP